MLTKTYDNVISQNGVIATNISAFLKSCKRFLNLRRPLSAAVYVDANHFHKAATFDTADFDFDNVSEHS